MDMDQQSTIMSQTRRRQQLKLRNGGSQRFNPNRERVREITTILKKILKLRMMKMNQTSPNIRGNIREDGGDGDDEDECRKAKMNKTLQSFTEDLMLEILYHLPPISVFRLKSVSKRWYSIISSLDFLHQHSVQFHRHCAHFKRSIHLLVLRLHSDLLLFKRRLFQLLNLIVINQDGKRPLHKCLEPKFSCFPVDEDRPVIVTSYFRFVDSCNGLLLHRSTGEDYVYYVSNPTMKQSTKLPNIKPVVNKFEYFQDDCHVRIMFDPSVSLSYKVIGCFLVKRQHFNITSRDQFHYQLLIYSSDTGSWELSTLFTSTHYWFDVKTVLLNGLMYWFTYRDVILCIDVEKRRAQCLQVPSQPNKYLYFGECGGMLQLIQLLSIGSTKHGVFSFPCSFNVMEQQSSQEMWIVKHQVSIQEGYDHLIDDPYFGEVSIMHLYRTGNSGEEALVLNINGTIVSFNLTSNTFGKELKKPSLLGLERVVPYTTTLFPLS